MPGPVAFEVLLEEIRRACWLSADQAARLEQVVVRFGGELLRLPSRGSLRRRRAGVLAARWLLMSEPASVVRDRLLAMGLSRRAAYRVISAARAQIARRIDGAR